MAEFLGVAFALLAAFCWSSRDVLLKRGLVSLNPLLGVFLALLTLYPVILAYGSVTGELSQVPPVNVSGILVMAVAGPLLTVVGTSMLYSSIKLIGASRAGTLSSTQALIAAGLAIFFLNEEWSLSLLGGIGLVMLGAVTLSRSMSRTLQALDPGVKLKGIVMAAAAAFSYGVGNVFWRAGLTSMSPSWGALISGTSALVFGTMIFARLGVISMLKTLKRKELGLLSGAALLDSLGIVGMLGGLSVSSVLHVLPVVNGRPIITILLSYLLIQHLERVNWKVLVSSILVVSGIYLVLFT